LVDCDCSALRRGVHTATIPIKPGRYRRLEDRLVDGDLVDDLLPERGLVALAHTLEVAERTVEAHAAVNHPGASLGERHQVDFKDAVALVAFPGERPAGRPRFVAHPAAAAELLPVDRGELSLDLRVERDEEFEELLAVVVDATLELEICLGDRHAGS